MSSSRDDLIEPKPVHGHSVTKLINKIAGQPSSFINRSNYTLGKTLGAGSFGIVREAVDITSNEKVAVKIILKKALKKNEVNVDMLYDELSIIQTLKHPNIVEFRDWFESKDKFYIVTGLATGGELFDRILKRGRFTESDAVKIVIQILGAVEYIHSKNIVHRDLKPENILYATKEPNSPIVIADFGIAKRLKNDEDVIFKAAGSLGYVAPEVLTGDGHGKPCDIWSIGVITYTLLCGYSPFIADTVDGFLEECMAHRYPVEFHKPYWDNISKEAKRFILRALVLLPSERLTATQLLEDPWILHREDSSRNTDILPNVKKGFDARGKLRSAIAMVKLDNRIKRLRNLYLAGTDTEPDHDIATADTPFSVESLAHSLNELRLHSPKHVVGALSAERQKLRSALAQDAFAQIVDAATRNRGKVLGYAKGVVGELKPPKHHLSEASDDKESRKDSKRGSSPDGSGSSKSNSN